MARTHIEHGKYIGCDRVPRFDNRSPQNPPHLAMQLFDDLQSYRWLYNMYMYMHMYPTPDCFLLPQHFSVSSVHAFITALHLHLQLH